MNLRDLSPRQNVLYRCYDGDERLIYVGATNDLARRVKEHRMFKWWWKLLVVDIRVQEFPTLDAARAAESVAIQEETPVFNQRGVKNWRNNPHWSESDHALYEDWYRRVVSA